MSPVFESFHPDILSYLHLLILFLLWKSDLFFKEKFTSLKTIGFSDSKHSAYSAGDLGSIPGLEPLEDPLEKGMVTHSSIVAWRLHEQRTLAGYSPWGRKESDMTEQVTLQCPLWPLSFYYLKHMFGPLLPTAGWCPVCCYLASCMCK